MKEHKLLTAGGKENSTEEEEKSKYQQIEEEVKQSIFGVFYLLLKNTETSYWKFVFILLIEYIQLLSFSFDESMMQEWKANDVVQYFVQFLSTFRIVYWLQHLSWDIYIIIFYICVFLVFVIIIDFLYVSISFKHKKFSFTQPVQVLKIACHFIVTILFVPIVEFFLSLSACESDPKGPDLIHVVYPKVICFQSIHAVHIAISYIMLLVFALMTTITVFLNYENRYTRDPSSKFNAKSDLIMLQQKAIYCFFFTFFSQQNYAILKAILLVAFSALTFFSYINNRPYYSQMTQTLMELFSGVFLWTNLVLLFTQVLTGAKFTGSLEILFLGIPIIVILIYTKQEERNKLLLVSENQFQKPEFCQKKNFYYIYIIETKEMSRESSIILKGYVNHHVEVCSFDNCPIKTYKKLMMKDKLAVDSTKKRKQLASGNMHLLQNENSQLLLAQGKALYLNGIRKFPKYMPLRIDYANYLQTKMRDRKGALNELTQAEKNKPDFDQLFMIYRQRKLIEDELAEGQEHGGIDFIAAMNFENMFKQFKSLIEKSALLHYEFWTHLQDDSPDLGRLQMQGAKINQSIMAVEDHWKKLSRMSSNAPKSIKMYASYLIEVLNDKETGNEQMVKAKEAANMRTNFEFQNSAANQDSDVNSYAQDGTPCVYISGESERLGLINQCNMSLCKIFGFQKKDDLINKNIKVLQPKIYADSHDEFLNLSIQKTSDQISSRERQIFGKHLSGYIFPLWLQIKNLPSLLSGRQYVATFKVEKTGVNKAAAYILFNKDREIADISPSCLTMTGITIDTLHKKQVYYDVNSLFPNLFQDNQPSSLYINKAGAQLNYCYPKIIQYQESTSNPVDNSDSQNPPSQRRRYNDGVSANGDDASYFKRLGTNGDQTVDGGDNAPDNVSYIDCGNNNGIPDEDNGGGMSYSLSHQKSIKSNNKMVKKSTTGLQEETVEEEVDNSKPLFQFRAIAGEGRGITFHANLSEIYFELLNQTGGYFLRLEITQTNSQEHNQALQQIQKRVLQQSFQFSFDPIFMRFSRELRDPDNKNFHMDKYFLDLKVKREQGKLNETDPILHRYAEMSYLNFLNRQQRMIERGAMVDDFEDEEEEGQSEDDSVESSSPSNNKQKPNKAPTSGKIGEFAAGSKTGMINDGKGQNPGQQFVAQTAGNLDFNKMLVVGEGFGKEFLRSEIDRLIKILTQKQQAGADVHTFIRSEGPRKGWEEDNNQKAGLFSDRGGDIEKVEGENDDEEHSAKDSSDKGNENDQLKTSIKSKKAFSMAINDKTMPPAIKKLSTMGQIILLCLFTISIIEYAVMYKQFSDTKENFIMIEKAYLRTAELQKVAYNSRSMILLSQNLLTNFAGFATKDEYVAFLKSEFSSSLDLIYKIQNEINLSQLSISDEHDQILNNKTVTLQFKEDANNMRALMFSLTESILQISSTIFTISNMRVQDFTEANEDVFFLMYNSFNDFYLALLKSSNLYVRELNDRSIEREEISLILYILAIVALVTCFVVLIPVVHSVNLQKDRVLTLFCEIDNTAIRYLASRCEKFVNGLQAEEGNDEIESNEELEGNLVAEEEQEEYGLLSGSGKRVKKAKGRTKTNKKFFIKFLVALLFIHAYYLQNFILNTDAVNATQVLSQELNSTAATEPFYWFVLNTQREMIYNKDRVITKRPSINVAVENIYEIFDQNTKLQVSHLDHQDTLNTEYMDKFETVMNNDLCPSLDYFKNTTTSCDKFISGTLNQGLHVVFIRYFETLRNMINRYQNMTDLQNQTAITGMFSLQSYYELYVIQNHVNQNIMRGLVSTLSTTIQEEFSFRTERKLAIFIVFLIVVLIGFIIFWLPFLNGLNYQIYKTKLMLMIIPLEVLLKIKNVGKVLQSQAFMQQSSKKGSNSGGSKSSSSKKK